MTTTTIQEVLQTTKSNQKNLLFSLATWRLKNTTKKLFSYITSLNNLHDHKEYTEDVSKNILIPNKTKYIK